MKRLAATLRDNLIWWLAPAVILLAAFAALLLTRGADGSPFIYSMF